MLIFLQILKSNLRDNSTDVDGGKLDLDFEGS